MRRLLFFSFFLICVLIGLVISQAGSTRDIFHYVCELTEIHYYKRDQRLEEWLRQCRAKAAQAKPWQSTETLMRGIQDHMSTLNVSHFMVYSPVEDKKLWKGETVDTGIRSRYVEDHLIVYRVFPESSAAKAGVKPGDEIISLPGINQITPWGAQNRSGMFVFKRGDEEMHLQIEPKPLVVDSSPQITDLGRGTAALSISSFRSEFFGKEEWQEIAGKLMDYKHVVIDVRENAGGNFVAMLRALSTFMCGDKTVGYIVQPRKASQDKDSFDDNTDDAHQIEELDRYRSIGLVTFKEYGCYNGRVTVLVSSDTSSVAEIFANSFKYRKNSRIWGQPTAGDVVLAVWYDLKALGPGYSISIPEAVYYTPEKEELEGSGVYPHKELFYDLNISLQGKDSWVQEAL